MAHRSAGLSFVLFPSLSLSVFILTLLPYYGRVVWIIALQYVINNFITHTSQAQQTHTHSAITILFGIFGHNEMWTLILSKVAVSLWRCRYWPLLQIVYAIHCLFLCAFNFRMNRNYFVSTFVYVWMCLVQLKLKFYQLPFIAQWTFANGLAIIDFPKWENLALAFVQNERSSRLCLSLSLALCQNGKISPSCCCSHCAKIQTTNEAEHPSCIV